MHSDQVKLSTKTIFTSGDWHGSCSLCQSWKAAWRRKLKVWACNKFWSTQSWWFFGGQHVFRSSCWTSGLYTKCFEKRSIENKCPSTFLMSLFIYSFVHHRKHFLYCSRAALFCTTLDPGELAACNCFLLGGKFIELIKEQECANC